MIDDDKHVGVDWTISLCETVYANIMHKNEKKISCCGDTVVDFNKNTNQMHYSTEQTDQIRCQPLASIQTAVPVGSIRDSEVVRYLAW